MGKLHAVAKLNGKVQICAVVNALPILNPPFVQIKIHISGLPPINLPFQKLPFSS
jgi:hypothetical protein